MSPDTSSKVATSPKLLHWRLQRWHSLALVNLEIYIE